MTTYAPNAAPIALPAILSVQRGLVVTDATFSNVFDDDSETPVWVTRGGIRGTVNTLKRNGDADALSRNVQITDTAKLHPEARAYRVRFKMASLPLAGLVTSIADKNAGVATATRTALRGFVARCCEPTGASPNVPAIAVVAGRYVRNLLNGRWLWRNRAEAQQVYVTVTAGAGPDAPRVRSNALALPLTGNTSAFGVFEAPACGDDEEALAYVLVDGFLGRRAVELTVEAEVTPAARGAVEVYPSQNYLAEKSRGFARSLYRVPNRDMEADVAMQPAVLGQAALRDQKVGNAIRTIDSWYPGFSDRLAPIAVEPNGVSLDAMQAFRAGAESSAFDLLTKLNRLSGASDCPRSLFMLSCLVRGAVFNEEKKDEKKEEKKDGEAAS